jgi:hypothetical protein
VQATQHKAEKRAPPFTPFQSRKALVPWIIVAALAVVMLTVGVWYLVDVFTPTETEAMLRDYVADWEGGTFADLPEYFSLGGTLVNARTGESFAPEAIEKEMTSLAGNTNVNVHNLTVGSSDRIATARFEIVPEAGDVLDGVSVWEIVGGAIRQQTISYVTVYGGNS